MPSPPPSALIFDLDGVLVDSNPFHLQKWVELLNERGVAFDPAELPRRVLGQRNDAALRFFLGGDLRKEELKQLSEELEGRFREVFEPHARPLPGLEALIREGHRKGVPMAVASSAMAKNIEFVVEALGFRPYFRSLVSGDDVACAKPDPEIYLKAAGELGVRPESSVAFEDSPIGLESARRAGMKCVAIASTFPLLELEPKADLAVRGFEEINLDRLRRLWR